MITSYVVSYSFDVGGLLLVLTGLVMCGLVASAIAYYRNPSPKAALGYFLLGTFLPVIGIVYACVRPRPVSAVPADWYADPWQSGRWRYWDGTQWTQHLG